MWLRWVIFVGFVMGVFYGVKAWAFKKLSVGEKVKDLKKVKSDVRSSLADEEQEIVSRRKALKEARKEV